MAKMIKLATVALLAGPILATPVPSLDLASRGNVHATSTADRDYGAEPDGTRVTRDSVRITGSGGSGDTPDGTRVTRDSVRITGSGGGGEVSPDGTRVTRDSVRITGSGGGGGEDTPDGTRVTKKGESLASHADTLLGDGNPWHG